MDTTSTFWMPTAASTIAGETDALFYFIFYVALFFFVLIVGLTIFFTLKYRRREGVSREGETPPPSHNSVMETAWIVVPTILVMVVFFWGFRGYLKSSIVPAEAMEVKVTGQKWFWTFDYPEGASTVNELVVPIGKPVKLLLSSRDVIHSFFIPVFRIKHDALPNRYGITWFEATTTGTFDIFCAEYCGDKHSQMIGKVKVVSEQDYKIWLETAADAGKGLTPAEYGEKLYKSKACITCHSIDGTPNNGPSFKGVFGHEVHLADGKTVVADENYIRESILTPGAKVVAGFQPIMPTFQGILKDKELDALEAFIKAQGK